MNKYELLGELTAAMESDNEFQRRLLLQKDDISEEDFEIYRRNFESNEAGLKLIKFIIEMDDKLDRILEKLEQ